MNDQNQPDKPYASPACYAHELDDLYREFAIPDGDTWRDMTRWRKAERERLLKLRSALDPDQRALEQAAVISELTSLVESTGAVTLGGYWPIHHEIDLRPWLREQAQLGRFVALPVICARNQPLKFSRWRPGGAMRRGDWGIAVPAEDDWVVPQLVIVPLVGVDRDNYRLGYGGGYYDRALAAADPAPTAVGVGCSCARIATIYPQPHDWPMDIVVTG